MKGFWFYQSLEAAIEKYPKAACHHRHQEKAHVSPKKPLRGKLEENRGKTGGKPEENWRKTLWKFLKEIHKETRPKWSKEEECISFANFNRDPDYINEEETNSKMVSLWNTRKEGFQSDMEAQSSHI